MEAATPHSPSLGKLPPLSGLNAPGVRTSLAVLVVGCILPIAAIAGFLIFSFNEREQAQLAANTIGRARTMVSVVDRDFASTQATLLALATSNRLAQGDLGGFHARATETLKIVRAESIVVVDPTGQLLLTTLRPFGEPLPKLAQAPLLKRIMETGQPGVSDLFVGPVTGRPIFTIAVPVRREGSVVYSLNATVVPGQLARVLTEQKLPDSWRATIVDSSGSVVARTHEIEKFLGQKVNADLLARIRVADEDAFETETLDGIPVVIAYSRSPATRWTVSVGMPVAELTAGLRRTLSWLIIATLVALMLGLSLAWFVGGRIASSITALAKPALALASGELPVIPRLYFKEANDMGRALGDAAKAIRQARHDAHHDALTGLANRTLFHEVVGRQLALCQRNRTELAILFIDLDGFKEVNDSLGHSAGDELLRAVAMRIKGAIRESDMVARLGGDEFAVAVVQSGLEDAKVFAERLIEILSRAYPLGEAEGRISASIGVAAFPVSATDVDTLLKKADQAMYQAKASGKRRVRAAMQYLSS